MAQYKIHVVVSEASIKTVTKKLREAFKDLALLDEMDTRVTKINPAPTRAERLADAQNHRDQAVSILDDLAQEMRDWFDNIPENLQNSDKASEVNDCADALEAAKDEIENADLEGIEFPGMF